MSEQKPPVKIEVFPRGAAPAPEMKPLGKGRLETAPEKPFREPRPTKEPERERYEAAQKAIGQEKQRPVPVERREVEVRRGFLGRQVKVPAGKKPKVRRVPDIGRLFEKAPRYAGGAAAGSGFELYTQATTRGRRFTRVRFNGRTLAPVFSAPEEGGRDEASNYISKLKEFFEPEYAAKREGMIASDSKFIRESLIKSRQSPSFVPVTDATSGTPRRLRA